MNGLLPKNFPLFFSASYILPPKNVLVLSSCDTVSSSWVWASMPLSQWLQVPVNRLGPVSERCAISWDHG